MESSSLALTQQLLVDVLFIGITAIALQMAFVVGHRLYQARHDAVAARVRAAYTNRLLALLADDVDDAAREDFIRHLPERPAAREVVAELLLTAVANVRGETRDGLLRILAEAGFAEHYRATLTSRHPRTRAYAAEMLGEMRAESAFTDLLRLLDDTSAEIRLVAARALGKLGRAEGVEPLLRAYASDRLPSGPVASSILQIGPAAGPTLQEQLCASQAGTRALAAELLGLLGWFPARDAVLPLLSDAASEVRVKAASCLGRLGADDATGPLGTALSDSNAAVRMASVAAMGQIGDATAVPVLAGALADSDHAVRAAAAHALALLGAGGVAALLRVAEDDDLRARAHAVEELQRLGYEDGNSHSGAAAPPLSAALNRRSAPSCSLPSARRSSAEARGR